MRLCFHESGKPTEVLRLEEFDPPTPQRHEVLVRMLYAPINPADLNYVEGTYGRQPTFPAVPGNEGCGRIEAVGDEVESLAVGDLVIALHPLGCWSQYVVAAENRFARLPEDIDLAQASMLRVNPTTAWQMIHNFRELDLGDFVVQNAANSGVGTAVIQIARHLGLKTVNFVRRPELVAELTELGGDVVVLDNETGVAQAQALVGPHPLRLALNAVGGDSALRLMEILAPKGTLVTYGAMSRRSLKIPNKYLIFKDLEIRGYWLSRWLDEAPHHEIRTVLQPLADLMRKGIIKLPVDTIYPVADFQQAITHALEGGRNGKIILKF